MILNSQYLFLMLQNIIGGTPVCYQIKLKGKIHLAKMITSLNQVIKAQPALQLKFDIPANATSFENWKTKLNVNPEVNIAFLDASNLHTEKILSKHYEFLLNKKTPITDWPLYECKLVKINKEEYFLFMQIDHVISDGLGNLQLLHQLFTHYSETQLPITKHSVQDYINITSKINAYQPSTEKLCSFKKYINEMKKESYTWNPNQCSLKDLVPNFQTIARKLPKEILDKWAKVMKNLRISLYSVIVSAYLDIFLGYYEEKEKIIFTLPTSGRIYRGLADISSYVGCFAEALTLAFSRNLLQLPLEKRLKTIHDTIYYAVDLEFDHIQAKKLAESIKRDFKVEDGKLSSFGKLLFRSSIKSNIYISYTGHSPLKKNYGPLQILDYKEGTFNSAGVCDFMHSIIDGELYFFGNYDSNFFDSFLVEDIINRFYEWMNEVPNFLASYNNCVKNKVSNKPITYLLKIFDKIFHKKINKDQLGEDLEANFGLDSLGRVRLIAQICKDHPRLDFSQLLPCRTLLELAHGMEKVETLQV